MALGLRGFVRWDESGQALLVSDAPKHMLQNVLQAILEDSGLSFVLQKDLLFIDLHSAAYKAFTSKTFFVEGLFIDGFIEKQAILSLILTRKPIVKEPYGVSKLLIRTAMLACAFGEQKVYAFVRALPAHDAAALREGSTLCVHACAALCAHYLYAEKGIGLPRQCAAASPHPPEGVNSKI